MRMNRTTEDRVVDTVNYVLLGIIAILTLYPFYYVLIASFNVGEDTARGGLYFLPRQFTFDNYTYFFQEPKWIRAFGVTVLRTLIGTLLSVLFTSMVAYGLAKKDLIFRKGYYLIVIVAMNVTGGLIAYYVVLKSIGLLNTFGVYVIPTMLSIFFLMIAVSFFQEIPLELGESARIDGASELRVFLNIVLPVSLPLMATMGLFLGSQQWNSWLDSAYFVQKDTLRTITYRMMEVINQTMLPGDANAAQYTAQLSVTQFSVQVTAMVISIFPIMCVYPFLQKYFVQGMMLGSVKG
ncbi:ABC transporter permease [Paenibacillus sp. FSL A5-0031]|uniref:carbohydrate ABC transporter permease n=1 Tax=Paenibacillus sp. FSL A5-0031 TaxID=1920420 RepID=UPI00096F7688|nr:carbohydrate ABC transporter permease [Paenibacillus sp. FSL A5-0031]OME85221.1 ABC transporter permease [Paenibacillus sp. FSL A5-0031]